MCGWTWRSGGTLCPWKWGCLVFRLTWCFTSLDAIPAFPPWPNPALQRLQQNPPGRPAAQDPWVLGAGRAFPRAKLQAGRRQRVGSPGLLHGCLVAPQAGRSPLGRLSPACPSWHHVGLVLRGLSTLGCRRSLEESLLALHMGTFRQAELVSRAIRAWGFI